MRHKKFIVMLILAITAFISFSAFSAIAFAEEEETETPFLPRAEISLYNGDFESDLLDWNISPKTNAEIAEDLYFSGEKSLHIVHSGNLDLTVSSAKTIPLPEDAAGDYIFSCFVKSRNTDVPKLSLNVDFYDANGTLLITMNGYPHVLNPGKEYTDWTEISTITTLPAGAVCARVHFKLTAGSADVYLDYITCTEWTNTAFWESFDAVTNNGERGSWQNTGAVTYENDMLAMYGISESSIRIDNVRDGCTYRLSGNYRTSSEEGFRIKVSFYDLNGKVTGETAQILKKTEEITDFELIAPASSCVYAVLTVENQGGISYLDDLLLYKTYDPKSSGYGWEATWVWHDEDYQLDAQYQSRYFRTEFELTETVESALMQFTADDRIYVYVNGNELERTGLWDSWDSVKIEDVTRYLEVGKNVIAVRVENENSYGGYLLDATIIGASGEETRIVTNSATTVSSKTEDPGWYEKDFDDSAWTAVTEHGSVPVQPWGALAYTNASAMGAEVSLKNIEITEETEAGGTAELSMTVTPGRDAGHDFVLSGSLWVRNTLNEVCDVFLEQVSGASPSEWIAGQSYDVVYAFTVPDYIDAANYQLQLNQDQLIVTDMEIFNNRVGYLKVTKSDSDRLVESKVEKVNGATRLFINDEITAPMIFLRGDRDQHWQPEYGRELSTAGVKLIATQNMLDGSVGTPVWTGDGEYDFTAFDEMAYKTLSGQPDALLLMQVDCNTPTWWQEKYPDECVVSSDGTTNRMSFASEKWRADVGEILKALMDHLMKQPYAGHIFGIKVTAGSTFEWVHWGGSLDKNIDYSPAAQNAWKKWLEEKYVTESALQSAWNDSSVTFETAEVPPRADRMSSKYNSVLDFETQRNVADFHLFLADMNVESLLFFAKTIKEAIQDRWIVGTYYGYLTTLYTYEANGTAHMGMSKALESPYLDFFCGPMNYGERGSGDSASWMSLVNGILENGKLYIMECDDRTSMYDTPELPETAGNHGQAYTVRDTVQQLIRDYAQVITKGAGLWWYDMHGGNFDYEEIYALFQKMQTEWEYDISRYNETTAEVAIFVDDDLYAYTPYNFRGTYDILYNMQYRQRQTLSRAGILYDLYHISDLKRGIVPEYPVNIVYSFSLDSQERTAIDKQLKRDGKTIVWVGLPGIYDDDSMNAENISEVTGVEVELTTVAYSYALQIGNKEHDLISGAEGKIYGEPNQYSYVSPIAIVKDEQAIGLGSFVQDETLVGLAYKEMGNWNSLFSSVPNLPAEIFINLIEKHGGHLYIRESEGDILFANSGYVGINSPFGGTKTIYLPGNFSVYDVFAGKYVSYGTDKISVSLEEGESRLYRLDDPGYVTVSVSHGYGGSVDITGYVKASIGSRKILHIMPEEGYRVSSVTIDGKEIACENNICIIENIETAHDLYVAFEKIPPVSEEPVNLGLILGLSLGGAALVIVAAIVTILLIRKRRNKNEKD